MKRLLPLLAIVLFGCTQAQLNTAEEIAIPIAESAAVAAGAYYGVPPSATQAVIGGANSLWGAYQMAQAGQPVAQGAVSTSIGNAIQGATAGLTQTKKVAALQAAATLLQQQAPATAVAKPAVSLWIPVRGRVSCDLPEKWTVNLKHRLAR